MLWCLNLREAFKSDFRFFYRLFRILEYFSNFVFKAKISFLFFCIFLKIHTLFIGDHLVYSRLTSHPPLSPIFPLWNIFLRRAGQCRAIGGISHSLAREPSSVPAL